MERSRRENRPLFFIWAVFLAGALITWACGPNPGGGGGSDDAGLTGDGAAPGDGSQTNGDGGGCSDRCNDGDHRCNGTALERCERGQTGCTDWVLEQDCASAGQVCDDTSGQPVCLTPQTCDDGIQNQDETDIDCGGICDPCPVGSGCGNDQDCDSGVCSNGVCKVCRSGSFRCFGNWVQSCKADESDWENSQHCDPAAEQICDPVSGSCVGAQPLGNTTPTGVYYQYAEFCTADGVFLGGFDIGSLGEDLYVNRDGQHIDIYHVELEDTDGDGLLEPNQHPENPDEPGEIEYRTITLIETLDIPISDHSGTLCDGWSTCSNELYPSQDAIFFTSQASGRMGVDRYDRTTQQVSVVAPLPNNLGLNQVLGFDDINNQWFTLNYERHVYFYHEQTAEWALAFVYPSLAGVHADGLEVVTDPSTNIPYVYVSDMTSDFLGQYVRGSDGRWQQSNLFAYNRGAGDYIEGMGFGALGHFWMSAVVNPSNIHETNCIYEIGGGDLSHYTGTWDPSHM